MNGLYSELYIENIFAKDLVNSKTCSTFANWMTKGSVLS